MNRRNAVVAGIGVVGGLLGLPLMAQDDSRPITLVVPFAPGGGSDVIARAIAPNLSEAMKVPVVVENRPGAGGTIATTQVAKAKADGKTLLIADMGFSANSSIYPKAGYDPVKDFVAIAAIASVASVLVVKDSSPYRTLQDLIEAGKSNPGKLTMASGGAGGTAHLIGSLFANQAKFSVTHVPYRGIGPAMTDVLAGHVEFLVATLPSAQSSLEAGRIKGLAITGKNRLESLPKIPTFSELGYREVIGDNVYGIVAPANTDPRLVQKLNQALTAITQKTEVKARMFALAVQPFSFPSPELYAAFLDADSRRWRKVVKENNIVAG